jgi:hypothetical protein
VADVRFYLAFIYASAIDEKSHFFTEVYHVVCKIEGKTAIFYWGIMFALFYGDAPVGLTFDSFIGHALYGEVYGVARNVHLVAGALIVVDSVALMYCDIIESVAIDAVHRIVFPYKVAGMNLAGEVSEPWGSGGVVYAMAIARNQFYAVVIFARVAAL